MLGSIKGPLGFGACDQLHGCTHGVRGELDITRRGFHQEIKKRARESLLSVYVRSDHRIYLKKERGH